MIPHFGSFRFKYGRSGKRVMGFLPGPDDRALGLRTDGQPAEIKRRGAPENLRPKKPEFRQPLVADDPARVN
ncbi:MAG: hypothetical protein VCA36_06035 [Opitutales bacterium]